MSHMQQMGGPPNMPMNAGGPMPMPGQMGGPPNMPMGHNMGQMQPMPGPMGRGPPPPQMYGNLPPQRMSGQGSRGSPYRMPNNPRSFGGTNIQVKPNAPNTIQYLPARPPPPHNQNQGQSPQTGMVPGYGPRAPPNLEFLQRYTNPSPGPVVNVNMGVSKTFAFPIALFHSRRSQVEKKGK